MPRKKNVKVTGESNLITVTATRRYRDTELKRLVNAGETLKVTPDRSKQLIKAEVATTANAGSIK